MSKKIEDIAISSGILDCLQDPYDMFKTGDPYGSVLPDMVRFAKLIIEQCMQQCDAELGIKYSPNSASAMQGCKERIKLFFGETDGR